ncbi:MAG: 3-deoxy-manno-octulosonate cytidylyltransferase [Bacteroidetes bacterium HGW-Bacteroidetes-17]|jgi:3-deoxy-manno-octulosonate cytidylyltransferase (CMP-KDO synthetase)|nr:MAG: 3-deoxy-manno-octulosonate cytidylyltransferase [Bacteroidetes bacterium HGW-Bacteroidetes-17]
MKIIGIIPARYESSRFPGKPLAMIFGKPMIQHVYENASKTVSLNELVVATDDLRIFDCVEKFGGKVVMTRKDHQSGSDRCSEVLQSLIAAKQYFDVAINIQGDEPFVNSEQLKMIIESFEEDSSTEISTLVKKIDQTNELFNPNVVKAVINHKGDALYFSRSPIPFMRDLDQALWISHHSYYKHIGIYGFRTDVLQKITGLKKSSLEKSENLEQLRWLENGYQIKTKLTTIENIAIDRPEDLKKITNNI